MQQPYDYVDSHDMLGFKSVMQYVCQLLSLRGIIDLSVLSASSMAKANSGVDSLPAVPARDLGYTGPTAEAEKFRVEEAERVRLQREIRRKQEDKKRLEQQEAANKNKKNK